MSVELKNSHSPLIPVQSISKSLYSLFNSYRITLKPLITFPRARLLLQKTVSIAYGFMPLCALPNFFCDVMINSEFTSHICPVRIIIIGSQGINEVSNKRVFLRKKVANRVCSVVRLSAYDS